MHYPNQSPQYKQEASIPKIWYIIILSGLGYTIIGIFTYFAYDTERTITHLPAWFRRTFDGIFVMVAGIVITQYPNRRPWRNWFNNSWILWYSYITLVVHYVGMLPPVYIYDRIPIFNKIMHVNASFLLIFLFTYGFERDLPNLIIILFTLEIGLVWEIAEFMTTPDNVNYWTVQDVGYGWYDTKGDLIANFIGTILGILTLYLRNWSNRKVILSQLS
jgi:hypothetical protein